MLSLGQTQCKELASETLFLDSIAFNDLIVSACVWTREGPGNNCINRAWPIKVNFVNDGGGNKSC